MTQKIYSGFENEGCFGPEGKGGGGREAVNRLSFGETDQESFSSQISGCLAHLLNT